MDRFLLACVSSQSWDTARVCVNGFPTGVGLPVLAVNHGTTVATAEKIVKFLSEMVLLPLPSTSIVTPDTLFSMCTYIVWQGYTLPGEAGLSQINKADLKAFLCLIEDRLYKAQVSHSDPISVLTQLCLALQLVGGGWKLWNIYP